MQKLTLLCIIFAIAIALVSGSERINVIPEVRNTHINNILNDKFLTEPSKENHADIALSYVERILSGFKYEVTDQYESKNGMTHVYGRQIINGKPVVNGLFNININSQGQVMNMAESFYKGSQVPEVDFQQIRRKLSNINFSLKKLAEFLNVPVSQAVKIIKFHKEKFEEFKGILTGGDFSLDDIPVDLAYVQNDDGNTISLSWHFNIRREENWWDAFVSLESNKVVYVSDWFKGAVYNVLPIPINDPSDGERQLVGGPTSEHTGSPLGWHDQGNNKKYTTTIGNNVYAQENLDGAQLGWENNYRPDGGSELKFDYPFDQTKQPEEYVDASVTNLFYWNNLIHDIFYEYGFDEVSGNFQENNFGLGGIGSDAVQANAQDGAGYNNANFATPPDGQRPKMRMYVWNGHNPMRDGDFDNGIIVHEYMHGVSIRLTGGPSNSNCMSGGQAGGMGEGHGDCVSILFNWRPEDHNADSIFEMGEWAAGYGIRLYPYSRNMTVNPQTYSYINGNQYSGVHAKGCVWCTIFMDLFFSLVEDNEFDTNWYNGTGFNNDLLQILTDTFKLQPCNPTFINTRDAMILADLNNFGGKYACDIWTTFARRGLGTNAVSGIISVTDGFQVPASCAKKVKYL